MEKHTAFLEKVKEKGNLKDLEEARSATEVTFRTLRDVMSNEAVDRVAADLDNEAEELWTDQNPIVYFLSRIRPKLNIEAGNFLVRVRQEGNLPGADAETVIKAVFSATKDELSPERAEEVSSFLPEEICDMWQSA
jgi:uncharacterized protein (DUF2267 family)